MATKLALMVVLLVAALPAAAHHANNLYDLKNPSTVKGVVTKVEWTNPHAFFYLTVKNAKGDAEEWSLEVDSPNFLKHNGWTSTTVKPGDEITCTGGRAKSGAKTMRCTTVELAGGQKLRS